MRSTDVVYSKALFECELWKNNAFLTGEEVGCGAENEDAGRVDADLRKSVGGARQMREHRLSENAEEQEDVDACAQ